MALHGKHRIERQQCLIEARMGAAQAFRRANLSPVARKARRADIVSQTNSARLARTGDRFCKGSHLADFEDKAAVAIRLRTATDSLTDLRDWDIARQYIRELEASALAEDWRPADRATATHGRQSPEADISLGL